MKDFLGVVKRQISEFFKGKSKKQKTLIAIFSAAFIIVVVFLAILLGNVEYEVLYTGLEESETGEILLLLEDMNANAKVQGSNTILVPSANADKIRMELAAKGYPQSGLNYNIFADASSLGTTDLQTKTYLQYQLQENLRDTILMLDRIEDCVVIINMPSESIFVLSSDESEASASVLVEIKGGGSLTNQEVKAIANLVLKSVSGLTLENISIVDSKMNLYSVTEENEEEQYTTTQYELTQQTREKYEEQVISILAPVFGRDNVSAAVNVVLNFDKETVSSIEFGTPIEGDDKGLAIGLEELYERTVNDANRAEGTAGTDSNGVGVPEYVYEDLDPSDFETISRSVNYELNEIQTQIIKQQGSIEKLTVAVILNSDSYSEDYTESIVRLVSNAIGADEESVSVESLPFLGSSDELSIGDIFAEQASLADSLKNKEMLKTLIISGTILAIVVIVILFFKSILTAHPDRKVPVASGSTLGNLWDELDEVFDSDVIDEIPERGKAKHVGEIEKFVDRNPAAAAQLLRNWLLDDDK